MNKAAIPCVVFCVLIPLAGCSARTFPPHEPSYVTIALEEGEAVEPFHWQGEELERELSLEEFTIPEDLLVWLEKQGIQAQGNGRDWLQEEDVGSWELFRFDLALSSVSLGTADFSGLWAWASPYGDGELGWISLLTADETTLAVTRGKQITLYDASAGLAELCVLDLAPALSEHTLFAMPTDIIVIPDLGYLVNLRYQEVCSVLFDLTGTLIDYSGNLGERDLGLNRLTYLDTHRIQPELYMVETSLSSPQQESLSPVYFVQIEDGSPTMLWQGEFLIEGPIGIRNSPDSLLFLSLYRLHREEERLGYLGAWFREEKSPAFVFADDIDNFYDYDMLDLFHQRLLPEANPERSASASTNHAITLSLPASGVKIQFDFAQERIRFEVNYRSFDLERYGTLLSPVGDRWSFWEINHSLYGGNLVALDSETGQIHDFDSLDSGLGHTLEYGMADESTLFLDGREPVLFHLESGKKQLLWDLPEIPQALLEDYRFYSMLSHKDGSSLLIGQLDSQWRNPEEPEDDRLFREDYTLFLVDADGSLQHVYQTGIPVIRREDYGCDAAYQWLDGLLLIHDLHLNRIDAYDLRTGSLDTDYDAGWLVREKIDAYIGLMELSEKAGEKAGKYSYLREYYDPMQEFCGLSHSAGQLSYLAQRVNSSKAPFQIIQEEHTGIYGENPFHETLLLCWEPEEISVGAKSQGHAIALPEHTQLKQLASISAGEDLRLLAGLTEDCLLLLLFDEKGREILPLAGWELAYDQELFAADYHEDALRLYFESDGWNPLTLTAGEDSIQLREKRGTLAVITADPQIISCGPPV